MPFVPEVIATAIRELEGRNVLGKPGLHPFLFITKDEWLNSDEIQGLFCTCASKDSVNQVVKELNHGVPLALILVNGQHNVTPELLADLIKLYCVEVPQGIFPADVASDLLDAHHRVNISLNEKLTIFQRIISQNLPAVCIGKKFMIRPRFNWQYSKIDGSLKFCCSFSTN